jgi:hypothetical protein
MLLMMNSTGIDLNEFLGPATGSLCWYVSVGGVTLPSFHLILGEKIRRVKSLNNPAQSEEFQQFEGEFSFLVWCPWRLEQLDTIIATSDGTDAEIVNGLERLVGQAILKAYVEPPAWDLLLELSQGFRLKVFCEYFGENPSWDGNWEANIKMSTVYVGPGTKVEIEKREIL